MSSRHLPRFIAATTTILVLAMPACAPQGPSGPKTGFTELCAPADSVLSSMVITVTAAPPGSDIFVDFLATWPDGDYVVGDELYPGVAAGGTYQVGTTIDAGLCLHIYGDDGVTYFTTAVAVSCAAFIAAGAPSCATGPLRGWPPRTDRLNPVDVTGIVGGVGLAAGAAHTCALLAEGTVSCWGANHSGQLGDGTVVDRSHPVAVAGISGATQIAAGGGHSCALLAGGTVSCWGSNSRGQLGDGTTAFSRVPVDVIGISGATAITAAGANTCAVLGDGTVSCWGDNSNGQLGIGTFGPSELSSVRVEVLGISGALGVISGGGHTCVIESDRTLSCWGRNSWGQLGIGTTGSIPPVLIPTPVVGLSGVASGDAEVSHTCAVTSEGAVNCWGHGSTGRLGNGTGASSSVPVEAVGISGAMQVATGTAHACSVVAGGNLWCWGSNDYGQLGTGDDTDRAAPVAVSSISGATVVAAGDRHTCALVGAGAVKCWGNNDDGQLGNGR